MRLRASERGFWSLSSDVLMVELLLLLSGSVRFWHSATRSVLGTDETHRLEERAINLQSKPTGIDGCMCVWMDVIHAAGEVV